MKDHYLVQSEDLDTRLGKTMFQSARLKLTLWYVVILLLILASFSLFIYSAETKNFTRVILQRDFGAHVPATVSLIERRTILAQVKALRQTFTFNLLFIDFSILIVGGILSYFLAGRTLQPIQETLKRQKEFLADASHEFRTPLAAIQTASEVALRSPSKTKEDYKKVIEQTYEESVRLGQIAEDLLLLSRIDSGMVAIEISLLDLSQLIENVIGEIMPLINKNSVTFRTDIDKHVIVKGDKNRLKQLVLILLDNAIKYTHENGTISISLHRIPHPTLQISDTGIGMTKKEAGQIFNRFYQADSSRTKSGAGLGLSIAKWIADQHNAMIKVKSEKGKGSTFSVIFPK